MLEDGTAPLVAHWSARSFRAMTRRAGAVLALALFVGVSPLDRLGVAADSPTLSAGARHTCAIDAADALHCWGDDSDGQTRVPADVAAWRAVAAAKGGCHTCGLALDGGVRCWGCDANGEVSGVPTVPGGNRWISVGAGKGVSCGVASVDRAVRCWGRFMPQVGANPWYGPWSRVTVGEDWVCALSANDAKARCRGWSANGQTTVPPRLADAAWLDLSAGFQHVCGVLATSPRSLACWGSGVAGESTPPTATEEEMAADPVYFNLRWARLTRGAPSPRARTSRAGSWAPRGGSSAGERRSITRRGPSTPPRSASLGWSPARRTSRRGGDRRGRRRAVTGRGRWRVFVGRRRDGEAPRVRHRRVAVVRGSKREQRFERRRERRVSEMGREGRVDGAGEGGVLGRRERRQDTSSQPRA